jgi:hypothetical protein
MKLLAVCLYFLCTLCASVANVYALDREAFTFTNYDLNVQIEPEQQRLGVRGRITLRNDSQMPQKIAVLQISSSLDWRSIKAGDKPLQFVSQPYTSDIDHTGGLSEAIVTLPQAVATRGTIELEIGYEGVIVLDATRLTRIGTPEAQANSSDWDQISAKFTAVRGAGYVAWYPIAMESADISEEGNSLFQIVGRWKAREAEAHMSLVFNSTLDATILFSGNPTMFAIVPDEGIVKIAAFEVERMGTSVPTFVVANYKKIDVKGISAVFYLPGQDGPAASYVDLLTGLDPSPAAKHSGRVEVAQLPDAEMSRFTTDGIVLLPFKHTAIEEDRLSLVYAVAKQGIDSPRPWIVEGLAHYAQVLDIEHRRGRQAALDYLAAHRSMLIDSEKTNESTGGGCALTNPIEDICFQAKAMWVWWMLRDLLGPRHPLPLFAYDASADKEPSYVRKLMERSAQRELEWFFDDWVYHDHGLPDFKVAAAFTRKTPANTYMLTITVENLGTAGAEVPLKVKFASGEISKQLEVRARDKAVIRVEVPTAPLEVVVNDGSVPESDLTNNTFKIEAADAPK